MQMIFIKPDKDHLSISSGLFSLLQWDIKSYQYRVKHLDILLVYMYSHNRLQKYRSILSQQQAEANINHNNIYEIKIVIYNNENINNKS